MGCSPSKGKLFPGPEDKAAPQAGDDLEQVKNATRLKTDAHVEEVVPPPAQGVALLSTHENSIEENSIEENSIEGNPPPPPDPDVGVVRTTESATEMDAPPPQENTAEEIVNDPPPARTEKKRKPKDAEQRQRMEKQATASAGMKVDLPPHMVRAHQAAYAYLNPNTSKYSTLLGLLDQAAQTHLSLQPMMSILVLHFEEINQALEEMAEEGEMMMREHGDYMAWPAAGKTAGPRVAPAKPEAAHPPDPPPDLPQQLLQHSTEKMRLVAGSFQAMGNAALEEKVEYFASLSRLLSDKLRSKRVAEVRLAQVLLRVEQAAAGGSHGDDITLHSEDSGIGGENESLAGSERHHRRRRHRGGSAGSASCGSGGNVRALLDSPPNPFQSHGGLNEGGEEEEDDDDDEEMEEEEQEYEENEEDEYDRPGRKRSNSSPPDPSRPLAGVPSEHVQHGRPQTAVTSSQPRCFPSSGVSDPTTEPQRSQGDLRMRRGRSRGDSGSSEPYCNTHRGRRQRSLSGSGADRGAANWSLGDFQRPGGRPEAGFAPRPPRRNTVRRLINTFSQGVDGRPGQQPASIPPHIKRPRRGGALILPDIGTAEKITNGRSNNNNNNSWPDSRDDLDVDSLPPPPPEVLMDDSFQSQRGPGRPVTCPRTRLSQRLRASVQNAPVLPNRATVSQKSSPSAIGVKPDPEEDPDDDDDDDQESETASALYQQAQKIIHLRNVAGSPGRRRRHLRQRDAGSPHLRAANLREAEWPPCTPPVTAPPVSRVRLPPSCPSVHHRFPSPPAVAASSRPGSPRTVAPSRSCSPRALASARDNHEEIVPMVAFSTARSVFCQMENQTGQDWTSSAGSAPSRPWGDPARGRQAARGAAGAPSTRTQSEQRPGVNSRSEMPEDFRRKSIQAKDAGRVDSNKAGRSSSPLASGGDVHSDFSAFSSAS